MPALRVALLNLKPGTGKTTSTVWLAHIFADAGQHVLLADADPSGSALKWSDLAAMDPRLPPMVAFSFGIVALPSHRLHLRVPEIAHADDVVVIDAPQLEDHSGIARSVMQYVDEILIRVHLAPSRSITPRRYATRSPNSESSGTSRPRPAVLLTRCIARAHPTANAREALEGLGYDVLRTAAPRLEVYAQSFGLPIPETGRGVLRDVAGDLIERCIPLGRVQS